MKYDQKIHNRRSIRLKGYDYSRKGLYFITICVNNRICLFGNVINGRMIFNDAGKMIIKWYGELENKYPDKKCHEMIVMPNHFHCIIENKPIVLDPHVTDPHVTDPHVTDAHVTDAHVTDAHVGTSLRGCPKTNDGCPKTNDGCPKTKINNYGINNQKLNATIGDAMDWFKTMTTNEYIRGVKNLNWERFENKLWQRNYWERIIRNQSEYDRISNYIIENPTNWDNDKLKY